MHPFRRRSTLLLAAATLAVATPTLALAHGGDDHGSHGRGADDRAGDDHGRGGHGTDDSRPTTPARPAMIALPNGFQPEGITSSGRWLYAGSIPTGAIFRADARTGQGAVLVPGRTGRAATGMKVSGRLLVVSGGTTGHAYLYDAKTGADIADVTLTTGNSFINDVAIAGHSAFFTDSRQQQLYRVDLTGSRGRGGGHGHEADHRGGRAGRHDDDRATTPVAPTVTTIPLTGDLAYDADPATNELNGIVAAGRGTLIAVSSRTGQLFRIDAKSGATTLLPVTGGELTMGDGLLLVGRTLFVVRNRLNQIVAVRLDRGATRGTVTGTITDEAFRVPTTITRLGGALYAVNARFGTPATPDTDYDIVRVPLT